MSTTPTREPEAPHSHVTADPTSLTLRSEELRCTRMDLYHGTVRVASAQVHASSSKCLEIVDLLVEPEHRNRGYGRAVLQRLLAFARDQGYSEVCAHASPRNGPAYRLFQSLGFHVCEQEAHLELSLD